jgi:FkbM family methyltransferase
MISRSFLTQVLVQAARRTPLSRGGARKFTLSLIEKMHPEPIPGKFRNVPFLFHLDNTTERKALVSDAYDKAELNFLMEFLSTRPGTFIDIGANSGLYSIFLASHMPAGSRVIAVEPNPSMCSRIEWNAALLQKSGLGKGVAIDIEAAALGEKDGQLFLDLGRGLGPAHLTDGESGHSIAVPVKTLCGLCRETGVEEIEAMKIDVEGYEDRILLPFLMGAQPAQFPRALVFETVHRDVWQKDAIAACIRAGYRIASETRSSIMMTRDR